MRGLFWFREDLRTYDNTALFYASKQCEAGLMAVYVIDTEMWRNHAVANCRVEFVLRGLKALREGLAKLKISLIIIQTPKTAAVPETLFKIAHTIKAEALFFNKQYETNESKRDSDVIAYFKKTGITTHSYDDQVILKPNAVTTQQGTYFKVFTPYKRSWQKIFAENPIRILPTPQQQKFTLIESSSVPETLAEFTSVIDPTLWPAGEIAAQQQLEKFLQQDLFDYDKKRDFPALSGTSQLSPYLATGMISAKQCFLAALSANKNQLTTGNIGALTWMTELIWREFYKHLLVAVPRISMGKPYQLQTEKIAWRYDESAFTAWAEGKTGYPIVDAAMRQLRATGWMHNRLRMIVAMFLSKNLLLDWRLGEKYFMQHLIDGDLAANNGGWQWCASTGTDAAPYFRVFNTVTQSERFDPHGDFIRQYCPELSSLNNKVIHHPSERAPDLLKTYGYPEAMVDLKESRLRFLAAFKNS